MPTFADFLKNQPGVGNVHTGSALGGKRRRRRRVIGKAWAIPMSVTKTDEDQQLVFGWASVVEQDGMLVIDKQGDIILPAELERAAYEFVLYKRDQGDMHDRIGVGRLVESMVFTREKQTALGIDLGKVGWWTGFRVDDPGTWKRIKAGELPEFSIGGQAVPIEV